MACEIEYSSELFEPATIAQIALSYHELLRGIVADPAMAIGRLPLLRNEHRRKLLEEWCGSPGAPAAGDGMCASILRAAGALTPELRGDHCGEGPLDVCRDEPTGQSAGMAPASCRRWTGKAGSGLPRSHRDFANSNHGDSQGRWRLRAVGPQLSGVTTCPHA